jgi:hypothetical protein
MILVWEFYFLPYPVHAQTNTIYVALSSLLWYVFKQLHRFLYYLISSSFLFQYHEHKIRKPYQSLNMFYLQNYSLYFSMGVVHHMLAKNISLWSAKIIINLNLSKFHTNFSKTVFDQELGDRHTFQSLIFVSFMWSVCLFLILLMFNPFNTGIKSLRATLPDETF